MRIKLLPRICTFLVLLAASDTVHAGEQSLLELKQVETVSLTEPWEFKLSSPESIFRRCCRAESKWP